MNTTQICVNFQQVHQLPMRTETKTVHDVNLGPEQDTSEGDS